MNDNPTPCQELLLKRYLDTIASKEDEMILLAVGMGANSFGFEGEIMDFLRNNPEATLQELDEYAEQFFPELEIVDDGELDEEDRNPAVYED